MVEWISALQQSIFFTAVILTMFFYGNKLVFICLKLFKLKENQEFIAFIVLVILFSSLVHKLVISLLVSLGIIGWIIVAGLYYFLYGVFKKEISKA